MRCPYCKFTTPVFSIFCCMCGEKIARDKKRRPAQLPVPKPRQLESGSWTAQLMINGERYRITTETEEEYYVKARATKAGLIEAAKQAPKVEPLLLKDAITKYIDGRRNRVKTRTVQQYEYIRDHRFQELMKLDVHKITNDDLDEAIEREMNKLSRKGGTVAPKTVIDAFALISTVLHKYAKDLQIDVDLPSNPRKFRTILPPEEIYPAIKGTDIELPCLLAMWFTFSMSEIRGFTKSKSLKGNKLYMVETVVDTYGSPERRQGGKEEERPRVHEMPPYMMELINAVDGDVLEPRSGHAVYMRFQKCLEDAGLPPMRFHDLRHVAASVMAEENIPTAVAQDRGGWKTDETMKRVYTHAFNTGRKEADKKINERFQKIVGESKKDPVAG